MFNHVDHNFPALLREDVEGVRRYVTPTGEKYASVTTVLADYNKEGILRSEEHTSELQSH